MNMSITTTVASLEKVIARNTHALQRVDQLSKMQRTAAWKKCIEEEFLVNYRSKFQQDLISADQAKVDKAVRMLTSIATFENFLAQLQDEANNAPIVIQSSQAEIRKLTSGGVS